MYFTTSDQVRIYFEMDGQGTPLVMLNGMWGDTSSWNKQVPVFSKEFLCIRVDHRGIGMSDKWTGDYSYDIHARDIHELLDHLHLNKCHLAGVCHGAMTAVTFAMNYPDQVFSLVLNGVLALDSFRQKLVYAGWRQILETAGFKVLYRAMILPSIMSEDFLKANESRMDDIVDATEKRMEYHAALGLIQAAYHYGYSRKDIKNLQVPAMIIAGEEDLFAPPYLLYKEHLLWRNSKYHLLDACAHFPQRECPERYNELVLAYLKEIAAI